MLAPVLFLGVLRLAPLLERPVAEPLRPVLLDAVPDVAHQAPAVALGRVADAVADVLVAVGAVARAVGARGLGVGLLLVLEGADRGDDLAGGEVDAARVVRRAVLAEVLDHQPSASVKHVSWLS